MIQQPQTSSSKKIITYRIAKWTWLITTWIWTSIIIAFLVQFIPDLLTINHPMESLKDTWTAQAIHWLSTPSAFPWEALRLIAVGVAILLVVLPPLAFFLKQILQNVQPEGFDKLMDILEQDTISPQLEQLSQQLWQQHLEQLNALTNGLSHVNTSINQASTISQLAYLNTLLRKQLDLQKQSSQTLQTIQAVLQQSTISTQLQQLDDLHKDEQKIQQVISSRLKQMQDQLSIIIPPNQPNGSNGSGLITTDPSMVALRSPSPSNQPRHAGANSTPDPNTASLAD